MLKSKTKDLVNESFGFKDYLKNKNIYEARTGFKMKTRMLDVKMNYQHNPKHMKDLWQCDSCRSAVDTQSHVLYCEAYKTLREDKDINNPEDIIKYFSEVMRIRSKLNLTK